MKRLLIYVMVCLSFFSCIYSRFIELNSRSRFFSRINESYLSVVQFYSTDNACAPNQISSKQAAKELKSRFNSVSQNSSFRQADIDFIMVNCDTDCSIARDLGFSRLPIIVIFAGGIPVPGARLDGFVHECDINAFIESYLSQDIDTIIHKKRKEYKQRQQAQWAAWAAWGPCWYNWGGCCRPCGWGFYGGWGGGGCCW